jgi:hypothetical protein
MDRLCCVGVVLCFRVACWLLGFVLSVKPWWQGVLATKRGRLVCNFVLFCGEVVCFQQNGSVG